MVGILTRREEAAVALVEEAYRELPTPEAKAAFHEAIQVYEAHPFVMFCGGFAFGMMFFWAVLT